MDKRVLVPLLLLAVLGAALWGYTLIPGGSVPQGASSGSRPAEAIADRAAQRARRAAEDRRTLDVARHLIAQTDSAFQTVPPLTAAEKRSLRRYLQSQHLERARRLGLNPISDRRSAIALEGRPAEERPVARIHTNDFFIIDPAMSYAVPLVVPSTKHLLERLGRRFQRALMERGLPPYRFLLTNVLRTGEDQAALRGTNVNAAQGQSTHEYGTTVDVYYDWFHYAAVHDTLALNTLPAGVLSQADSARAALDEALLRERLYEAYTRFGKAHASKIRAVLGRVILEMQNEGQLLATYERQQHVFHLTIADDVAPPVQAFRPPTPSDAAGPPAASSAAAPSSSSS